MQTHAAKTSQITLPPIAPLPSLWSNPTSFTQHGVELLCALKLVPAIHMSPSQLKQLTGQTVGKDEYIQSVIDEFTNVMQQAEFACAPLQWKIGMKDWTTIEKNTIIASSKCCLEHKPLFLPSMAHIVCSFLPVVCNINVFTDSQNKSNTAEDGIDYRQLAYHSHPTTTFGVSSNTLSPSKLPNAILPIIISERLPDVDEYLSSEVSELLQSQNTAALQDCVRTLRTQAEQMMSAYVCTETEPPGTNKGHLPDNTKVYILRVPNKPEIHIRWFVTEWKHSESGRVVYGITDVQIRMPTQLWWEIYKIDAAIQLKHLSDWPYFVPFIHPLLITTSTAANKDAIVNVIHEEAMKLNNNACVVSLTRFAARILSIVSPSLSLRDIEYDHNDAILPSSAVLSASEYVTLFKKHYKLITEGKINLHKFLFVASTDQGPKHYVTKRDFYNHMTGLFDNFVEWFEATPATDRTVRKALLQIARSLLVFGSDILTRALMLEAFMVMNFQIQKNSCDPLYLVILTDDELALQFTGSMDALCLYPLSAPVYVWQDNDLSGLVKCLTGFFAA